MHHLRRLRIPMSGRSRSTCPSIIGLRRGAVNTGKWEDDYGTKLFLKPGTQRKLAGLFLHRTRQISSRRTGAAYLRRNPGILLWLGCMGAYDPRGREIVASLAQ